MNEEAISKFREMPKTKVGLWALWLGLSPILVMPFLGIFAAAIRPAIDRLSNERIGAFIGFSIGAFFLLIALAALFAAITAIRKGERSWGVWLGFFPTFIWVILIIGELTLPH